MALNRSRRSKLLIVDDHAVVRDGLRELFAKESDLEVVGEAKDEREALRKCAELRPDVVILDLSLGLQTSLSLVKELQQTPPHPAVLVFSMHDEKIFAQRALQSGARGYVGKHEDSTVLLRALRRVIEGRTFVSEAVSETLLASLSTGSGKQSGLARLSDREIETMRYIGEGLPITEIARRLGIGVKTVETHRARIKEKLGVDTATEVVILAANWLRDGFLEVSNELIGVPTLPSSLPPDADDPLRVLVVDDDISVRRAVSRALLREGILVLDSPGGEEALSLLKYQTADVALVDVRMPRMGGIEFLRRVTAQRLPCAVVIFTGLGDVDTERTAVEHGASGFLRKPLEPKALVREIKRAAAKRAERRTSKK